MLSQQVDPKALLIIGNTDATASKLKLANTYCLQHANLAKLCSG